jgi:Rieske Fe-S protein
MDRRNFIRKGCMACLGAAGVTHMLASCHSLQAINGKLDENGLWVDSNDFLVNQQGKVTYRSYIIVRNEALQYPVCVYRFNDTEYTALWMQCTHQGTELQASGNLLHCPAHGSEFSNRGKVLNGPADRDLRYFPVTISGNQLFIDLRKK